MKDLFCRNKSSVRMNPIKRYIFTFETKSFHKLINYESVKDNVWAKLNADI